MTTYTGAIRTIRGSLRLSLAAVACIGLGAAATASVATLVNATLIRALPFPQSDRLVRVWFEDPGVNPRVSLSIPDLRDAARLTSFDTFLGIARVRLVARFGEGAERMRGEAVSPGYFETLGVQPILGRLLDDSDGRSGASRVMVLSYRTWLNRFGASPDVVGTLLKTESSIYTIVGVASSRFTGTVEDDVVDFWTPLNQYEPAALLDDRVARPAWAIARLRAGATSTSAQGEATSLGEALAAEYPDIYQRLRMRVEPMGENWRGGLRRGAWLLAAAAVLLLIVAMVNVAGLMIARVMDRRRELALRSALGATRVQLGVQLIAESFLIAAAGAALGAVSAPSVLAALLALSPVTLPHYIQPDPDAWLVLWCSILLAAAGTLAGAAPALLGSRADPCDALKEGARGQVGAVAVRRWARWLVAAETALTLVLLVAGNLLIRTWQRLDGVETGYRVESVARLAVTLSSQDARDRAAVFALSDQVRDAIGTYPGVERVGLVWPTLPPWDTFRARLRFDGLDPSMIERGREVGIHVADEGLLPMLGVPIVAGRNLRPSDGPGTRVAVVSRALADRLGGVAVAIDHGVMVLPDRDASLPSGSFRVVGIAENVAYDGVGEQDTKRYIRYGDPSDGRASREDMYLSLAEFPSRVLSIGVATSGSPAALLDPLRRRIGNVAPTSAVHWTGTMADEVSLEYGPSRFYASLVTAFSMSAVILMAIGLFALLSHAVARRRAELALRIVLGATPSAIAQLVVASSVAPLVAGVVIGLAMSVTVGSLMRGLLYGVSVFDPAAYLSAVIVIVLVALAASVAPVRRGVSLNPARALSDE